jgi:hypothetical protein
MASVCENDAVSKFSSTQYTAVVVRAASSRQDSLAKFSDAVHAVAAAEVTRSFLSLAGLYMAAIVPGYSRVQDQVVVVSRNIPADDPGIENVSE